MKKYELTNVACYYSRDNKPLILLHRIRALKDFGDVKAGDFGGWIEREYNLSQDNNCWVKDDAMVFNNAVVRENAVVQNEAIVYGSALVFGESCISRKAKVYGNLWIQDHAIVSESAEICGASHIHNNAAIRGNAIIANCDISGDAKIFNKAYLKNCLVKGRTMIHGNVRIEGLENRHSVIIGDYANIYDNRHIFTIHDPNVKSNVLTFYKNKSGDVSVGMFPSKEILTLEEFKELVGKMSESDRTAYEKIIAEALDSLL